MLKPRKKLGRSHLVSLLPSLSWHVFRYGLPVLQIVDNLDDTTDIVLRDCHLVYRYIPMRTKQTQDWTTIFKSSSVLEAPRSVDEFHMVAPGVTRECFRIESRHEKPVVQKAKICGGCFAYENASKSLGRNNLFHVQPGSRNVALLSKCVV